jgi:hypothetical protein
MFRKIAPHACFKHTLKASHDTGFGFGITGSEEMNGRESMYQFSIGKLSNLILLYVDGASPVLKDLLECYDNIVSRFLLDGYHPGISG